MKKERLGFNLTLMGMIASGKETQTEILKKKYALYPVETGVYTRKLLKEKSDKKAIRPKNTIQIFNSGVFLSSVLFSQAVKTANAINITPNKKVKLTEIE